MTETRATYHVGDPGDETTPRSDALEVAPGQFVPRVTVDRKLSDAAAWANSPEGQEAVRKALAAAKVQTDELARARQIDWRDMNTPITRIERHWVNVMDEPTAVGMAPSVEEMAAAIQRLATEHHKRERLLGKDYVPHRDLMRANQCVEAAYNRLVALAARLPGGR